MTNDMIIHVGNQNQQKTPQTNKAITARLQDTPAFLDISNGQIEFEM